MIRIIARDNCVWCDRVQELLADHDIAFEVIKPPIEELRAILRESGVKTVPQVFNGSRRLGGYTEVKTLLETAESKELLKCSL